jgi:hypothetical protein
VKVLAAAILVALSTTILSVAARAQGAPRTIEDCERINEPLAYNACLASFGPKRGEHGTTNQEESEPAEDEPAKPARGTRAGRTGRRAVEPAQSAIKIPNAIDYGRTRNGRAYVVFDVGGAKKPPAKRHRKRRNQ